MDELRKLKKEQKELIKEQKLLQQLYRLLNGIRSKNKLSAHDNMIFLLKETVWMQELRKEPELFEKLSGYMSMEPVTVEVEEDASAYEQMTLFDSENEKEKGSKKKRKISADMFSEEGCFIKSKRESCINGMLFLHDKTTLKDYLKYLVANVPNKINQKEMAETLGAYICEHPLSLLPALPVSVVKILLGFERIADRECITINHDNMEDYSILLLWGLLALQVEECNGRLHFLLTIPKEVEENILPVYRRLDEEGITGKQIADYLDLEKTYTLDELERHHIMMFMQIREILTVYGGVEQDTMYQMFMDLLDTHCGRDDFFRFVYLFGTFHQLWTTGMNQLTKEHIIGRNATTLERIIINGNQKVDRYYEYHNYGELKQIFSERISLWDPVEDVLAQWELSEDIMTDYIAEYSEKVADGYSLTYVMERLEKEFNLEQVMDAACLWRQLVIIYQHYPCYLLKGYNHLQAEKEFGLGRYDGVFEVRFSKRIAKVKLHELPVELQQQLADMVLLAHQGNFQAVMEQEKKIDGKYLTNPAVNAVLVMNLADAYSHLPSGEKQQWEEQVKKRVELWCRDIKDLDEKELMIFWCEEKGLYLYDAKKASGGFKRTLIGDEETGSYYWKDFEPEMKPIIKAEKIYPNDPCPCGSGKKYKKCCGR